MKGTCLLLTTKIYTQEQLLEKSAYLYESEKETYWKELDKTGYFQTTTKNKIEKIYKDNHYGVSWIGRGKNKKLKVGKKKPNPKPRTDNRGGNYTEYAEAGAKLLVHHINNLILKSHVIEPSFTRTNWLNTIRLTSGYRSNFTIEGAVSTEVQYLTDSVSVDENGLLHEKVVDKLTNEYKWLKNEFYR